eukprot:6500255-Alexandrium_andersonii.AAC.1
MAPRPALAEQQPSQRSSNQTACQQRCCNQRPAHARLNSCLPPGYCQPDCRPQRRPTGMPQCSCPRQPLAGRSQEA